MGARHPRNFKVREEADTSDWESKKHPENNKKRDGGRFPAEGQKTAKTESSKRRSKELTSRYG